MEAMLKEDNRSGLVDSRRSDFWTKSKAAFFETLRDAFFWKQKKKLKNLLDRLVFVLESILLLCHLCSVIDWPGEDMQVVHRLLAYTRVDVLAMNANMTPILIYFHLVLVLTPPLCMILRAFLIRPQHWLLRRFISYPVFYFTKLALLPTLTLHGMYCKCLLATCDPPYEYSAFAPTPDFSSAVEQSLSLVTIPLVIGFAYCHQSLIYPLSLTAKDTAARSHSAPLVTRLHSILLISVLHLYVRQGLAIGCVFAILAAKTCTGLVAALPYYNMWVNAVEAGTIAAFACVATVRVVVELGSSTMNVVPLILIIPLPVFLLVWQRVASHFAWYKRCDQQDFRHLYELDFGLRHSVRRGFDADRTLGLIEAGRKKLESDFIVLWEAAILLRFAGEPIKADLKLALCTQKGASMEVAFQRYLLHKATESGDNKHRDYLEFLMILEEVKVADEVLCQLIIQYCNEVLSEAISVRRFEKISFRIVTEKNQLSQKYRSLMGKYQTQGQICALFGTFLTEVLGDSSGVNYIYRSEIGKRKSEKGVICLYAEKSKLGGIALFNEMVKILLMADMRELRGQLGEHFLPTCLQPLSSHVLHSALVSPSTDEVSLLYTFLQDTSGFLVNISASCTLTAWNEVPLFFISLYEDHAWEKVAINSERTIVAHSRGLSNVVLAGLSLDALFVDFLWEAGYTGETEVRLRATDRVALAVIKQVRIHSLEVFLIAVKSSSAAAQTLFQEPQQFKGVKFTNSDSTNIFKSPSKFSEETSALPTVLSQPTFEKMKSISSVSTIEASLIQRKAFDFRINRAARRTKVLLLISYLSMIAVTLVVLFSISDIVDMLLNQDSIRAIGRVRYVAIEAATVVRCLSLIQSGFLSQSEDFYRAMLVSDIGYFQTAMDETSAKIGSWPAGRNKDMHFQKLVPQWVYYDESAKEEMQSLMGLMEMWMRKAKKVNNSVEVNFTSLDVRYLFRNGPAEDWIYSNKSVFLFLSDERQRRLNDIHVTTALIIISACALLLTLALLVLPQIIALERLNTSLWIKLYEVPNDSTVCLKQRVSDRLEAVHGLEMPHIALQRRVKKPTPTSIWPLYACQLVVLICLSASFFLGVFSSNYEDMQARLTTLPNFLNWSQLYHLYFEGSCFWNREKYLLKWPNMSYPTLMSDSQYWPEPDQLLSRFQQEFVFNKHIMRTTHDEYGVATTDFSLNYTNFSLSEACSQVTVSGCGSTALSLGVYYAANEFMQLMADMTAAITAKNASKSAVMACESKRKVITTGRRFLNTIFEDEMRKSVLADLRAIQSGVILYTLSLILVYFSINWFAIGFTAKRMHKLTDLIRIFGGFSGG